MGVEEVGVGGEGAQVSLLIDANCVWIVRASSLSSLISFDRARAYILCRYVLLSVLMIKSSSTLGSGFASGEKDRSR